MTGQQEIIAIVTQQLERLFGERIDREGLSHAEAGNWSADLWDECAAMGLPLLLVPEERGGIGLSWQAAMEVFRLLGRFSVPLPVGETIIAARMLADAGLDIPDGPLTFAAGGGAVLQAVPWARAASHVVVLTGQGGDAATGCYRLDEQAVTPGSNIARDPRDDVALDRLVQVQSAATPGSGAERALRDGALLRCGQTAGALAAVTALAADYANTRIQFGKPIRAFQAVQQSLAVLASEAAAAAVAALAAAAARDEGDAEFEIAVAKIRTGMAAGTGSALGHQAHGAIGFTDEYSLHYLTRRLLSWRCEFGSDKFWARRLGESVMSSGRELWSTIADR